MRPAAVVLLGALTLGCAADGLEPTGPAARAGATSRAPYKAPPAGNHSIEIQVDSKAAQDLVAFLSLPHFRADQAKAITELPAVRLAIQDSGRTLETFERDLAAAFDEEEKSAVFDLRTVRAGRARWSRLLTDLEARRTEVARLAALRAAALLPSDRVLSTRLQVYLSFGLAGLADHLVVITPRGDEVMIVDLARALGDSEAETVENQVERVARLVAGEAFRQAWRLYRAESPNWARRDTRLGELDPLFRLVAEQGPVALFHVDENFYPLSVWLKEPMKRTIAELNRFAERLVESEKELEERIAVEGDLKRPEFAQRVAGPAGAFLCDGIIQTLGIDAFRAALAGGPTAFFAAYGQAVEKSRDLVPLSDVVQARLRTAPR
ncbi:MAG TPA: hypothetical protein VNC59_01725 [Thermoanaerobaculia bacterium]|nr:hypothetical protein [Thermoanaerobaculia bacterium]